MIIRRTTIAAVTTCTALGLTLSGCGNGDEQATPTSQTATSAAMTTTGSTTTTAATNRTTISSDNSDTIGGTAQTITAADVTARIEVKEPQLIEKTSMGEPRILLFPIVLDVDSGTLNATSTNWKVRTLSGQTITGDNSWGNIPTAMGNNALDGHAEGLVLFPGIGDKLTDDVSIAEVALYPPNGSNTPLARWTLPEPVAVPDLPRSE
ncbi:hypothetical protein [Rhodococcus sp. T7]|nr:hypothetical protein [Rhodococcus sp. T7]KAF0957950.1 hypothetical protein MLGJGCBP_09782 [Rhodococcus sp. T7]KAF0960571.1 hypothetical protein MLGJGCBP_06300 [Rhodococcus sp. T7]UOT07883.2 hypothetical protein MPY17_36355 [Rhodococcus opacus]